MHRIRVIPSLLMENGGLVKTVQFGKRTYLGDPINIIRIFNDKEVDEIALLDIGATPERRGPDYAAIEKIASQCFMPLAYGGGITKTEEVRQLFKIGVEKAILNTSALATPHLITEAANAFGAQAIVVSIDVKKSWTGKYDVITRCGKQSTGLTPAEWAKEAARLGAGEIFLNSIDRDGTMKGYDVPLIRAITSAVDVPVIACGGANSLEDFRQAVAEGHATAVAAGSMFVFHGKHRAVLINYPTQASLKQTFSAAALPSR
jgi:cyclase